MRPHRSPARRQARATNIDTATATREIHIHTAVVCTWQDHTTEASRYAIGTLHIAYGSPNTPRATKRRKIDQRTTRPDIVAPDIGEGQLPVRRARIAGRAPGTACAPTERAKPATQLSVRHPSVIHRLTLHTEHAGQHARLSLGGNIVAHHIDHATQTVAAEQQPAGPRTTSTRRAVIGSIVTA